MDLGDVMNHEMRGFLNEVVNSLINVVSVPDADSEIFLGDVMNYEVKIRINGVISYVQVAANSAGQAQQQVKAMYGANATILGAKIKRS